jgi:tetratricopeptide (TPR) repeat protein
MARRRTPLILATLCAAAWLAQPAPAPAAVPDPVVVRAEALIDAGRPAEAAALLEQAVAGPPREAERYFWLGIARYQAGATDAARAAFLKAVEIDPRHARAYYNLGAGYFAEGRWEDAAEAFLKVPPLAPDMAAGAYLDAGLARYRQGRVAAARALFAQALAHGPDPKTAATARRMLAVVDTSDAAAGPERPPAAVPGPPRRWFLNAGVGREFDTNVLLSPNDPSASHVTDWRTVATFRAGGSIPLGAGTSLTPEYSFLGYAYDSESAFDYRTHRLKVRLDATGRPLRPRLEYSYTYGEFGGTAYMNTHGLAGRLQVAGTGPRAVWTSVGFNRYEAPGGRYDYLSGREWTASLMAVAPLGGDGTVYGTLDVRQMDAADLAPGPGQFYSYSYVAAGPFLYVTRPWRFGTRVSADLRYEHRLYRDRDAWTAPVAGSRRRHDHRLTTSLRLSRPVLRVLELEVSWQGQIVRSNIGDDPGDYANRDFTRNVFGVTLRLPY